MSDAAPAPVRAMLSQQERMAFLTSEKSLWRAGREQIPASWPSWAADFLDLFERGGFCGQVCRIVGVLPQIVYRFRDADEEFASAWAAILDLWGDTLECASLQRAIYGCERPIYGKGGEVVATYHHYDFDRERYWIERFDKARNRVKNGAEPMTLRVEICEGPAPRPTRNVLLNGAGNGHAAQN